MDVWQYLSPANPVAQWIVIILGLVFLLWLLSLLYWLARLIQQGRQMKRCAEVGTLAETLSKLGVAEDEGGGRSPDHDEVVARESAFGRFCAEKSLRPDSLVARHIKAIFEAGCTQSRLEIGELIKHTSNGLLRGNAPLRSLLGTFIVFGLLGTLFGLADSLAQLSPITPSAAQQVSENVSQGLGQLLAQLKSAFAPSICGITFTIAGLTIFTLYVHLVCNPVKNLLERLTLTVWVPQLFPNTTQRLQSALRVTEQQIRENLVSIERVALFSREMEGRMDALNKSFDSAGDALKVLARSSSQIDSFVDKFVSGISGLTSFQEDLRCLYVRMADDSKAFHESLRGNVERSEEFHKRSSALIEGQSAQLASVLSALNLYEEGYLASRIRLDRGMEGVLAAAKTAFEGIGQRNEEVVEALGAPLRQQLTGSLGAIATTLSSDLGGIERTLNAQLRSIEERLGKMDAPLTSAADTIENTLETVVKRTEVLTQQLHREILGQDEKNRKQLEHLGALNEQIASLLQSLSKFQEVQTAQFPQINRLIGDLSQNVAALGGNLKTFGQNLTLGGPDGQQLEVLKAQNARVVVGLDRLSQSINLLRESGAVTARRPEPAPRAPYGAREGTDYRPPLTRDTLGRGDGIEAPPRRPAVESQRREEHRTHVTADTDPRTAADVSGEEQAGGSDPDGETRTRQTRAREPVQGFVFTGEDEAGQSGARPTRVKRVLTRLRHPFRRS
ncbi:MAG: hypothetical protein ACJ754_21220 [Pyrinomonadaceae bacterium]